MTTFRRLVSAVLFAAALSAAGPATAAPPPASFPATAPRAAPSVELYTTSWCPACNEAKAWLGRNRVAYTAYDVERDRDARERFRRMNPRGGVPFAVIDGEGYAGFDPDLYARLTGVRPTDHNP